MRIVHGKRPRIALNAQLFRLGAGYRSAGISRYSFQVLRQLAFAANEFDLDVYATEPRAQELLHGVTLHTTRLPVHRPLARILWEQTLLAWELHRQPFALFHSLAYVTPWLSRTPYIVTLYDMTFYRYPQYLRPIQRLYLQIGTRAAARHARRIITISESSKNDVIQLLEIAPERIDVVTPGVEPEFFREPPPGALDAFRRARQLPDHFVLYLGTREPRKNIPTLIRAFAAAKRAARLPQRLVIAGGRGWMDHDIPRALAETKLETDVLFPGFVSQAELPLWYRAADVFVYPSQYEGFGMPPLEALACGTPVITSNVSSLPEAVGDAAVVLDPRALEQLEMALTRVLTNPGLQQDLRERGPQHARRFTWTRAAQVTAQTYRHALGLNDPLVAFSPASV